ncbi:hypothetical protein ACTOJ1_001739 [Shigella flexneri]
MDYSKLSNEELISLLEKKDEEQKEEILTVPDTELLKSAYDMANISIDVSDAKIENDDYDNSSDLEYIEKRFESYADQANDLYNSLKADYLAGFSRALKFAASNDLSNNDWGPEYWLRNGVEATLNEKELLVKFLGAASPHQRDNLFNDYFTLDSEGQNKASRYQIGSPVYSTTLLYSLDSVISYMESSKAFNTLAFISDFVNEKEYPNKNEYNAKIKDKILYKFNSSSQSFDKGLFFENMKNGNKFNITSEDTNLRNTINLLNHHSHVIANDYGIKPENKEARIHEACSQLEKIINTGLWDEQIKNIKDSDFETKAVIGDKDKVNNINQIYSLITNDVAKERFRSFIDGKSLDLNYDAALADAPEIRRKYRNN